MGFVAVGKMPSTKAGMFLVCDGVCDWDSFGALSSKLAPGVMDGTMEENDEGDCEWSSEACVELADRLQQGNRDKPHYAVMHNVDLPSYLAFLRTCGGFLIFCLDGNDDLYDHHDDHE
jgi:hypothetical protein